MEHENAKRAKNTKHEECEASRASRSASFDAFAPPCSKPHADKQAHYLLRDVGKALRDFDMVRDGDNVAVAVSGGKDSLSLLELLDRYRRVAPVRYQLSAIHVCGDATGITPFHEPLEHWLASRGLLYRVVEPELNAEDCPPLDCQRCTWLRRKALFTAADELGCNVLAYAHHADDVAQTALLNILYVGNVRSLAPAADYFDGRFRLIRPLVYLPERELAAFGRASGFPAPPPACPRGVDSRRATVKQMLRLLGTDYARQVRGNLMRLGLAHVRET